MIKKEENKKNQENKELIEKLCSLFDMNYEHDIDRIVINSFLVPFENYAKIELLNVINNLDKIKYGDNSLKIVIDKNKTNYVKKNHTLFISIHDISYGSAILSNILFYEIGRMLFNIYYFRKNSKMLLPFDTIALLRGQSSVEKSEDYLYVLKYLDNEYNKIDSYILKNYIKSLPALNNLKTNIMNSNDKELSDFIFALKERSKSYPNVLKEIKEIEDLSNLSDYKDKICIIAEKFHQLSEREKIIEKTSLNYLEFGDIRRLYLILNALKENNNSYFDGIKEYKYYFSYPGKHFEDAKEKISYEMIFACYSSLMFNNRIEAIYYVKKALDEEFFINLDGNFEMCYKEDLK